MGNCHYQQPIRTRQIVFFPKLKANSSKARFTKSPKTRAPKKKKKKTKDGNIFLDSRFRRQLQHRQTQGHSLGGRSQQQRIERPRQRPFLYQPPPGQASPSPPQKGALWSTSLEAQTVWSTSWRVQCYTLRSTGNPQWPWLRAPSPFPWQQQFARPSPWSTPAQP